MAISIERKAKLFDEVIDWLMYPPIIDNPDAMTIACDFTYIGLTPEEAKEIMEYYNYPEEDIKEALQENYDYYEEETV